MNGRARLSAGGALLALALTVGCSGGGGDTPNTQPPAAYSISGAVTGATTSGVTVALSGSATAQATSDNQGTYTFTGLSNGAYTVRATKAGFAFNPISLAVPVNGANVTGQNFDAVVATSTYTIYGTVAGATGVTVSLTGPQGGSTVTDGAFSFQGVVGGSYTLSAQKTGYTFANSPQTVVVGTANVTAPAMAATLVTYAITGHVAGAPSVLVTLTAPAFVTSTATTDGNGDYAFPTVVPKSYTVTPSKAGYTFSPPSAPAVVSNANVTVPDFDANLLRYSISGTVFGVVTSGVPVTLSGDADMVATTAVGGGYTFAGVLPGSYTVTPRKSGYTFTPASLPAVVATANVVGKDFSSAVETVPVHTLSGTVTGPYVEGVRISLSGGATTTTTANGAFSFPGLVAGDYMLTPSLAGYAFSPSSPTVTISTADRTQLFTEVSAVPSYTISGNLSYTGTKRGNVFVRAMPWGCMSPYCATAGTAVLDFTGPTTASYTIHGLPAGMFTVRAELDVAGYAAPNALNPSGTSSSSVTVGPSNTTATADVILTNAPAQTPETPTELQVGPGPGGAFVTWTTPEDMSGAEIATSYRVTWSTDPSFATSSGATLPAYDNPYYFVTGLSDGSDYYFNVTTRVNSAESAPASFGPVTIGAVAGLRTVSGTVTRPAGVSGGSMYVLVMGSVLRWTRIANPGLSVAYTITGVPDGAYEIAALYDSNGNGMVDDPTVGQLLTVSGNTVANLTFADASTTQLASVATNHWHHADNGWDGYSLSFEVDGESKQPIAVTILSGPNIRLPADLPCDWNFRLWESVGVAPAIGDAYKVRTTFSDGTTETTTLRVSAVLGTSAFPQNLVAQTTTPGSIAVPLFTWEAPQVPPTPYTYRVGMFGDANWWWPDNDVGAPSSTTSVLYNADGGASTPALGTGTYTWYVTVEDANRNQAQLQKNYTVP